MKSLLLVLCLVVTTVVHSTCPPVAPSCPIGVAEGDPPGTTPKVCSGKGTCRFGACECTGQFGDIDCGAKVRKTKLASVFLSQAGLDDGPTRYFDIITQLVELLRIEGDFSIPPQSIGNCKGLAVAAIRTPPVPLKNLDLQLIENSITVKILNGGIRTGGTARMKIPKVPLDVALVAPLLGNCCGESETTLKQSSGNLCSVQCAQSRGDFVSFDMDATLTIDIFPVFNRETGEVTININENNIGVTFNPPDMGFKLNCDLGSLRQAFVDFIDSFVIAFGRIVASQVLVQVRDIASEFADQFSLSGTRLNVTQDLSAQAFVPFMEFVKDSHIAMELEGFIFKDRFAGKSNCPKVVTTFVDRTVDGNALGVPNALQDIFWRDDENRLLQTLFGMRLARSAMTVGTNALMLDQTQIINAITNIRVDFGVLDADFNGALDLELPTFGFPAKSVTSQLGNGDFLEAGLSGGSTSVICNQTGEPLFAAQFGRGSINLRPLIIGSVTDFQAAAEGRPTDANFRVTLQVFDLDVGALNLQLDAPVNVSVPNALTVAMTTVLAGDPKMEAINQLLEQFAIPVPAELTRLAPGPRVESLHDPTIPGTDGKNGFFQISTRCLCQTGPIGSNPSLSELFFVVKSKKFGEEIVPRCIVPCPASALSRASQDAPPAVPATQHFQNRDIGGSGRRRRLANATAAISGFLNTTQCGPDLDTLKLATKSLLVCAQRLDVASTAKLQGKFRCMRESSNDFSPGAPGTQFEQLGACDPDNTAFARFAACPAPVSVLTKDLFGQTCTDGASFRCDQTLAEVFADNCRCATNPGDEACSDALAPALVLAAGWAIPLGFFAIVALVMRFVEGCCTGRAGFNEEERIVSFFRVKLSRQDKYFLGLAGLAVFALGALTLGWVVENPFLLFVDHILQGDVFTGIQWVTTNLDDFAIGWSLAIMFAFAFAGSTYLAMILYSIVVGRCAWLVARNTVYIRNGEWFVPSEKTLSIWKRNAIRLQWMNRLGLLFIITTIFAPPIFFTVRTSVTVSPPQFDAAQDNSNAGPEQEILGNITSLATSQNALDLAGFALGFTLMSTFLGFLSSVFLLAVQGAVPAAFSTASLALYWTDAVQRQETEAYHAVQTAAKSLLPPPDNSDKDRWRRSLHFFVWCAHASGWFGSLVAAILVYQTLRAPPEWALIWIVSWIVTLPGVFFLVSNSKKDASGDVQLISGRRRLLTAVVYSMTFFAFTIAMVALAPQRVSFASPLAIVFLVAVYLYVFIMLISEYCNIGTYTLRDENGKRTSLAASNHSAATFEVGYAIPLTGSGNSKQGGGRIKSVTATRKNAAWGGNTFQTTPTPSPRASWMQSARDSIRTPVVYEEREMDFGGSQNPGFRGRNDDAAPLPPMFAPPFKSSASSFAPPIYSPPDSRLPAPPMFLQQHQNHVGIGMDPSALQRASERISIRYGGPPPVPQRTQAAFNGLLSGPVNNELKSRISTRLQSRGIDPRVQDEMAERIATFAANGGANSFQPQQQLWASPASSVTLSPSAKGSPLYEDPDGNNRFQLGGADGGGLLKGKAGQVLKDAVARTRESVVRWGEDPRMNTISESKSTDPPKKVWCDNIIMNVLFERKEREENTYGLRVVPARRVFFVVGLVMLFALLVDSEVNRLSVESIKRLVLDAVISLLSSADPDRITPEVTSALDFESFNIITASVDPPLQEYVNLARTSFIFLWIVFGLFFTSLMLELYYSRCGKSVEQKRRGIKRARLVAFAHFPFLFIAIVIPSSADYVTISLGGLGGVVPICAAEFNRLVFDTASNLFGLAMGGLLAVQTMVVLLLIVPAIERALAFVVAREIFDLQGFAQSSKTFIMAEKRLKIARLLYRNVPFMSPILLYIPTILIAQLVAQIYSSILVYVFYLLPIVTSHLRRSSETKEQKPYQWILFSTLWTGFYLLPLGIIGLVEVINLGQIGFLADLLLDSPIFFLTIVAEVSLAIVIMSDVLYLFISSDDEYEADRVIDMYLDAVQEEANSLGGGNNGGGGRA